MKSMVIFVVMLMLFIPIVHSKEISIPEVFETDKIISSGETTYFYAGSKLIASKGDDEITYHYQDRLGSDVESKSLPFGQSINKKERFSFTGKELDSELHYFNARYYDSNLGRFTSVDPIPGELVYGYVMNNPLMFVDPDGRRGEIPFEENFKVTHGENGKIRGSILKIIDELGLTNQELQHVEIQMWDPAGESLNGREFRIINSRRDSDKIILGLSLELLEYSRGGVDYWDRDFVGYALLKSIGLNSAESAQRILDLNGQWKHWGKFYFSSGVFHLDDRIVGEVNQYNSLIKLIQRNFNEIQDIEYSELNVDVKWVNDANQDIPTYWEHLDYLGGGWGVMPNGVFKSSTLYEDLVEEFPFLSNNN